MDCWRRRLGNALMLAGLLWWASAWRSAAWRPAPHPRPAAPPVVASLAPRAASVAATTKSTPWQGVRLVIPRLRLNLAVAEGTNPDDLCDGPLHLPASGGPGGTEQTVIVGHRNAYGAPFRDLDRLRPGDPLFLTAAGRAWRYRVTTHRVLAPEAAERLLDEPGEGLLLWTCHPYWRPTARLLVAARLDGPAAAAPDFPPWHDADRASDRGSPDPLRRPTRQAHPKDQP